MEDAVRAIVRPSERLKLVLEARDPTADDDRALRVLAVVVHIVESGSIPAELEQGWYVSSASICHILLTTSTQSSSTEERSARNANRILTSHLT
jgi:hypothetical protein